MGPDLWELFEDGNGDDEVAAIIRLGHYGTLPKGVRVVTQFSEIITIRTTRANIPKVSGAPEVTDIAAGNTYMGPDVELESVDVTELSPDTVLPTDERRPKDETATGKGVVVGVVDWGFDFAHPDFLKKDGSTRILALWDQRGSKLPNSPQPFGYGVVHDHEAINRALKEKDPYAALGYHPADADTGIGCHGTHVLSIAAGSGGDERPTGIAPEADLVVVHNAPWDEVDTGRLGDSVTLLEGIDFIARTAAAGNHPWVINLSMGRHGEQHDGSTLIEQGLDAAIRSAPGRAICLSAGNYFDKRIHASGQLRPTQERKIIWEIVEGKPTYNQLEFWYSWQDKFELAVRSPDGSIAARAKIGDRSKFMVGGKEVGNVYHRGQEPNNLDNHITVYLYKEAPAGEWEITLIGEDVIDGRYHAWIERDVSCPKCQSRLRAEDADPRSTTGTICNGRRTLAVGAYSKHDPEMRLGHFSSVGPTRDGRLKPDLCAPGVSVLAARSAPRVKHEPVQLLTRMSGTSMAAPHVTGTVALMFQAAPRRLRIEETHNLLLQSARKVSVPEDIPERIGIGFLDIEEAVEAARKIRTVTSNFNQTTVQSAARPKTETESPQLQTESELYKGFDGEFAQEGFESRADVEFETETVSYFNTFHRIASDITSAFEGGKTGTLNLYDLGIISYGKHQATLHSGTLFGILKRFTELSRTTTAVKMSNYLDRVKLRDESLREDAEFIRLLKDAAKEPEMDLAQDEEFGKQYWEPAKRKAATNNIKTALGHAIFYDTKIQGGLDQVVQSAEAKLGGKTGEIVNGQLISEQHSLRTFVDERIQRNLRISASQKKQAADLNEAAKKLDGAAAADPVHAEELKKQAAEKRKKASEYAANSAALEVSSNKTRGPSFVALVESGDLNLYGGDAGKIYLKGKPGVVIVGLKPGAAIDVSKPALVSPATVADSPTSTTSPQHWFLDESEIKSARGNMRRELSVFSSDNLVQPLVDGKDLMSALHDDLTRTKKGDFFHLTAWRLNITQDLTPGVKPLSTSPSRFDKVLQAAAARDVRARALIWKAVVAGFNPSSVPVIITENTDARNLFNAVGGKGVIDGRYPYAGSHHQKSAIIQREGEAVAYCGGIDIAPDRWDTQSHNSDVRRTREVYAGWHDIHVRMRGPVALDIELNFRDRWNAKETPALVPHEPVPPPITDPLPHVAKSPGKHHVQVLRTFACTRDHYHEFAPKGETTCLAGYVKAIARAEKYIYIEDQYLVSEELADALAKALNKIAKLVILVPRLTDGYPAEGFNYHQAKFLTTVTRRHPDKVHVFHAVQPSTGETIYIHSKVMIIDDIYAVVGSPNVNRRSTTHDTELAAAVIDAEVVGGVCRFARDLRLNLWAEHLNLSVSDAAIADPVLGVKEWERQAKAGTFRVRYHVTPADRDESKRRWDYVSDPDGRCVLKSTPEMYLAAQSEWAPLSEAVESAPAAQATEFVELANQIVGDLDSRRPSDHVLHEIFERAESLEALATAESGVLPTAAQIFDSFVYPSNSSLSQRLGQSFELVALPQEMLDGQLCKGDVMVRRLDGDSGHVSIIASPQLKSKESLLAEGLTSESFNSGMYAQVVEAGAFPHDSEDKFARELTDSAGRLLNDILILRLATPPPPTVITVQQPAKTSGDPDFESGYEASFLESEGDDTILASASREISLQGIADGALGKLSSDVLSAILIHGESDANELTNREFWQIHPDWSGKKLDAQDPKQQALRAEWSVIFRRRVKPIIWLRALINQIDKYRGTLPREFLLGWIAWESDGYIKSTTTLGELGYFQIMWQGGEAKSQLHLTFEEFQKLSSDPKFSIEKGIALAEAYRQYILRSYSSVEDGSELLWRLTKCRHAASGVLKTALNSLVKTSTPITWASVSRLLPVWMVENVNHTMQYAAKLKPFADLVPAAGGGADYAEVVELGEGLGPPSPLTETFPTVEFTDHEEWVKIKFYREELNAGVFVEKEISDSSQISSFRQAQISSAGWFRKVGVAANADYELKWKGRIYYPRGATAGRLAGTRAFPVAILLHGNHGTIDSTGKEIDNHLGYEYLQAELARNGIVSLSISTNVANAMGMLIRTRADFVLAGLQMLKKLNSKVGGRFYKRLDLQNVGMMGHSRGGDAVVKAAVMNHSSSDFTVRAVCSLAPTDFSGTASNALTLTADGLRYLVVYGSHDGDVGGQDAGSVGTGFRHYDRALCERTMVFIKGAKHNRFNTKWNNLPDYSDPADCTTTDPDFLTPPDHQQLAIDYICGLFRLELNHVTSLKGLFDGSTTPSGSHAISLQWNPPFTPRTITTILHGTLLDATDKWTKGWTTLVSLRLPGSDLPFELGYKASTGEVTIDRIDPQTGTDSIWSDKWRTGWTHFMPFLMPGDDRPHHLAYMAGTGDVAIDRIARDGKSVEVNIWKDSWSKGWSNFMPVRLPKDDKPYYLAYKKDVGDVSLDRIKPIGQGTETLFTAKWSKGWTIFMPFRLPGDDRQCYLAYKKDSGDVSIDRIDADGKNISTLWNGSWSKGWTSMVPFRVPGDDRTYLLAYKQDDGTVSVDRIHRDGHDTETILEETWTKKWSHFLTFEVNGKPHFLSYKVDQGDVSIGRLLPDRMLEIENFEDRPGGSAYDPKRDLLNAASSLSSLTRVNFQPRFFSARPIAVQHQTHVLSGRTALAKYRAEIPPENRNCSGFDLLTFRLASDFKLDSKADISSGKFPDFKVRVTFGKPSGVGTAEANQGDIDVTGVRQRQRPFFREINGGACVNGTKIAFQTIAIPLSKFVGANWSDVRAVEFEAGPTVSNEFYFDSLALMQS